MDILPQLLVNSLITGSIYALSASGLCLTHSLLKILNFAHGHLMMVGAYFFLFFAVDQGYSLYSSGAGTVVLVSLLGAFILKVFINPFKQFNPLLPFVTTLALSSMLEALISLGFGVNVRSLSSGSELASWELMGIFITPIQLLIIVSAMVVLTILALVIHRTPLGRKVRALSENSNAAQSLGIRARRIGFWVFVISTILAAYAGVLVGYETNLQPTMGNSYTIKAFAAMILGGLGSIWGTVFGSYILGLVENLAIGLDFGGYSLPAGYKDAFAFLIILAVLLVRPQGLFGSKARSS